MAIDLPQFFIAAPILVVSYALIMIDRVDRSVIALLGAGAMILTGVLTQEQAIHGVDFNTIGLLTGMMVLVAIARRSGVFEFVAIRSAQLVRASPSGLMAALAMVTALLSALLDNVTTVLLVAPVTIAITRRLGVAPYPYLVMEVLASNFGGTATLIGDPPNILIGSSAPLSFNAFLVHMLPAAAMTMAAQIVIGHLVWGRRMQASATARAEVMAIRAGEAIIDARLLRHALLVFGLVLLGFTTARFSGLEPGTIAMIGAAALMLLENHAHGREHQTANITATYGEVDWITIFFFVGLFILVHGVQATGAMGWLATSLVEATRGDVMLTVLIVLWGAALLSAVLDNIPFVAAMIPVIKAMEPAMGGEAGLLPLWVALSLGACFGGNATLIGATANLTVAGIAQREGIRFDFITYTRSALPLTLVGVAIAHVYLVVRYF